MIKTSIYAPQLAKFPARLGKILLDTGREKGFLKGLNTGNPTDLAVLDDPDHFKIVSDGMKHSTQQGVDAFTLDVQGQHTDWTEDAKALQVPVSIILGSESTVQTPMGLERYLAAIPSAKVYKIDGAGVYAPITHYSELMDILDTLETPS